MCSDDDARLVQVGHRGGAEFHPALLAGLADRQEKNAVFSQIHVCRKVFYKVLVGRAGKITQEDAVLHAVAVPFEGAGHTAQTLWICDIVANEVVHGARRDRSGKG